MKIKPKKIKDDMTDEQEPDIFHAAEEDDVFEAQAALNSGQNLHEKDDKGMSPMHVAANFGSENFINFCIPKLANTSILFDYDDYNCRPIDYSSRRGDKVAINTLSKRMFPDSHPMPFKD